MNNLNELHKSAMEMLKSTSRTFFIPISYLPSDLQEVLTSAYLCLRAIDEIEDHHDLQFEEKYQLLNSIGELLKYNHFQTELNSLLLQYNSIFPEVILRLSDWIKLCPLTIRNHIINITSTMSIGMSEWVLKKWNIQDEEGLNEYTYYAAGIVGILLSDIWKWYDGTETNKELAIAFGRGLQTVNIIRDRSEDLKRGLDFFPDGWSEVDMHIYAQRNLALANHYLKDIKTETIFQFCKLPLALAHGTLDALKEGRNKMSKKEVNDLVNRVYIKN
ncbi:phytoene/squalene synthase family protein [Bacillus sp. A17A.1]